MVYGPSNKGPSLLARLKPYKNVFILIALAIAIVAVRGAIVLTTIYWLIIGGLAVAVLVLWLRGRQRKGYYPQQNRYDNSGYGNRGPAPTSPRKAANVIPFKKKRGAKSKAKPD